MKQSEKDSDELWQKYNMYLKNEGMTKKRIHKLNTMYTIVKRGLKEKIANPERKDIEKFVNDVTTGYFKRPKGKDYSGSTKSDIKKFLKQFYKWLKGDNEEYPKIVSWIKTKIAKDEKPEEKNVVKTDEVIKLSNSFKSPEFKLLTLILFDSGFRIQEALSVKKKDLTWEEYEPGKKCWWVACNISKTQVRKVPIPLFTEEIKLFVNTQNVQSKNESDKLFDIPYNSYRIALVRNSEKLLGKKLSPHCLRHSSATYYCMAYDGHMGMIADRYGWSYSSKELATYIKRSGAYQKIGAKKVYTNEVTKVIEENKELKERLDEQEERMKKMRKEMENEMKAMKEMMKDKILNNKL